MSNYIFPLNYDESLFRPPAEAESAILQVTLGCSWNKCAFCEMYSTKKYKIRPLMEIEKDIKGLFDYYPRIKRFFLADGDAMSVDYNLLKGVVDEINNTAEKHNYRLQRVASYALPKNILSKSDSELKYLRDAGLKLLYVGIETGDDELLGLIKKGETYKSTVEGIQKAHDAGIDTSIMIITGLGGRKYSEQHARNTARIINALNPKYLSTLTLSFPLGFDVFKNKFKGDYIPQTTKELFEEMYFFISLIDVENVIFRSNHVSNNLSLDGILCRDKENILKDLKLAIENTPKDLMPKNLSIW